VTGKIQGLCEEEEMEGERKVWWSMWPPLSLLHLLLPDRYGDEVRRIAVEVAEMNRPRSVMERRKGQFHTCAPNHRPMVARLLSLWF
jgi:hypothetical protein